MRPRLLILSYDSRPVRELLNPLLTALSGSTELYALVQFPETAAYLRTQGVATYLIKPLLGWEHGRCWRWSPLSGLCASHEWSGIELGETVKYETEMDRFLGHPGRNRWEALALRVMRRFAALLELWKPDLVIAWNGNTLPWNPCLALARAKDVPTFCIERGFFPNSLFVDPVGTNGASSVASLSSAELLRHRDADLVSQRYLARWRSNYRPIVEQPVEKAHYNALRSNLGLGKSDRLLLLPEQLEEDTNTRLFSPIFSTNSALLSAVIDAARSQTKLRTHVVFKLHPERAQTDRELGVELGRHGTVVDDVPLGVLLRQTDAVVTRNSTVGFEALLAGKRCVAVGRAIFTGKGISDDVEAAEDLPNVIGDVLDRPYLSGPAQSRLLALVTLVRRHHHFFGEPTREEQAINQALVDGMLHAATGARSNRSRFRAHATDSAIVRVGLNPAYHALYSRWWATRLRLRSWRSGFQAT